MRHNVVGQSVVRREGHLKVTGQARYVDDLAIDDFLYGVTIRSHLPHGRIRGMRFVGDIPWHEFVVVRATDIPGQNVVALIDNDQPCLADAIVNHQEEAIVLLAHADFDLLQKARTQVIVDIEALEPVLSIDDALSKKTIIWGKDNIFKFIALDKGNVDEIWSSAHHVIEGEYHTGAQEQLYIEPNGVVAKWLPDEGITIWGSMQCPFYIHKALKTLLNLPDEKVRVIQVETGGGFGGKEDYPSMLASHAALLSFKSGKAVKMIYDRAEDMAATTKRHPSRSRYKTAVDSDGKILAMDIEFFVDGGAYLTLTPVVLSRGTLHALGPYVCPHVRIRSTALATNMPPNGAFRGFGAPQTVFALERHMDQIARVVGLAPEELRRRNFISFGDIMATGQVVRDRIDMNHLLERAMVESDYRRKRQEFDKHNQHAVVKKGIGLATFIHGAGFTGSGEKRLASIVGIEATLSGKIRVLSGSTEIGQGTNTIFCQIAADALGIGYDAIEVAPPDTRHVPDSGPTVASRTCMVVGKLVENASIQLKHTLIDGGFLSHAYSEHEFLNACRRYIDQYGELHSYCQYVQPPEIHWDDDKYQGDAYPCYAKAVYVAEVSVDTHTYEVRVDDFVAVQDVGKVVHPILAEGQIEGGIAQGIGYAIYEKVIWDKGVMKNNRMTNYIVPTAADAPTIRVLFEETKSPYGPQGAVGIGELPLDGTAPAVLSAIEHALTIELRSIPLMPEDIMTAMEESSALHD